MIGIGLWLLLEGSAAQFVAAIIASPVARTFVSASAAARVVAVSSQHGGTSVQGHIERNQMGFSNVTGKYRPKRGGCETATQRKKRRYRTGDQETAQDIRVVKKQKSERAVGDRAPAQLPKQKSAAQKRLKALVKKNEDIKKLRRKAEAGAALDAQQTAKLAKGDAVLLELHEFLEQHPAEAAAYAAARDEASKPR